MELIDALAREAHLKGLSPDDRTAFLARERLCANDQRREREARRAEAHHHLHGHKGGKGFGFDA